MNKAWDQQFEQLAREIATDLVEKCGQLWNKWETKNPNPDLSGAFAISALLYNLLYHEKSSIILDCARIQCNIAEQHNNDYELSQAEYYLEAVQKLLG